MDLSLVSRKKSAVSPVIATLLLIAIAVAAAIIVFAFVTGLIGGLSTTGNPHLVQVTGGLTVPTGNGAGTLVINVRNGANNPITSISLSADAADGITGGITSGGVSHPTALSFFIYGPGQNLAIGQSTSGVATFQSNSGITAGSTYAFTVTVTFTPGVSAEVQDLSLTAEA